MNGQGREWGHSQRTRMMSPAEATRYARHLAIPEFGAAGQERLRAASLLCVGAGGLGSPALLYLAAAGVGRIGIVEADVVEESNLQRQLLFRTADVGRKKVAVAAEQLRALNPFIRIEPHDVRFTRETADALLSGYDCLLDGTDNFATRYLSNDIAVLQKKANVYGSILRFEGQASVFAPHLGGPCYRCLFPTPPAPGAVPSCAEGGVLGVLPGLVGAIQANEAIKLLAGIGQPLVGRLLHVDALSLKFREIKLRRDPACPLCGDHPTQTGLVDYEALCGLPPVLPAMTIAELADLRASGRPYTLLDVREPDEVAAARFPESVAIPLGQLAERMGEIPAVRPLVVHCKAGGRSARAVGLLREHGVTEALNLTGGFDAWQAAQGNG